jgi:hypothetical protein
MAKRRMCSRCNVVQVTGIATKRYCARCRRLVNLESGRKCQRRIRERRKSGILAKRIVPCLVCGHEFVQPRNDSVTCSSECQKKRGKLRHAQQYRERRQLVQRTCRWCSALFGGDVPRPSQFYCQKACAKAARLDANHKRQRIAKAADPERFREYSRRNYWNHREQRLREGAERNRRNRKRRNETLATWRARSRERIAESNRRWRKNKPDTHWLWKIRRKFGVVPPDLLDALLAARHATARIYRETSERKKAAR